MTGLRFHGLGDRWGRDDEVADVALDKLKHALSHPFRLKLIEILEQRATTPSELEGESGISKRTIEYHLGVLVNAGCIEPARTDAEGGGERSYRAAPQWMMRDVSSTEAGMVEVQLQNVLNWHEITVDAIGLRQVLEVIEAAGEQIKWIAGQSADRQRFSRIAGTELVVGVVAASPEGVHP